MRYEKTHDRSRKGAQLVTFRLGAEYYGIHVSKVREILRPLELFPVPGMGKDIEGVINLRGEIIPVAKLHALLGIEPAAMGDVSLKRRMIIVEASRGSFGFFVDEVLEVTRIQTEEMQASPDLAKSAGRPDVVTGIVKVSGRMVVCLDSEKLIPDDVMAKELAIGG
jgi:chemotaxis signal transduction protein